MKAKEKSQAVVFVRVTPEIRKVLESLRATKQSEQGRRVTYGEIVRDAILSLDRC